jgi:hypothetical protein
LYKHFEDRNETSKLNEYFPDSLLVLPKATISISQGQTRQGIFWWSTAHPTQSYYISISQGQIRQGEMMKTHNTIGPNYLNNIASS